MPLASTSTLPLSGCGWLTTGALPSRLGEYDAATARASGVPGAATASVLRASSRTVWCTRLNSTSCGPPAPLTG